MADFPFASKSIILLDRQEGAGFGVSIWLPPRGIWGCVTPRHERADEAEAFAHAARFSVTTGAPLLYVPADFHALKARR